MKSRVRSGGMAARLSLRRALADPNLLGNILTGQSWRTWTALLIAAMGEALTSDEREIFTSITGRQHEPLQRCEEWWGSWGAAGGKSRAISVLATYLAGCCQLPVLGPG